MDPEEGQSSGLLKARNGVLRQRVHQDEAPHEQGELDRDDEQEKQPYPIDQANSISDTTRVMTPRIL